MEKVISLAHGDGGELSHRLIKNVFIEAFGEQKGALFDAAAIPSPGAELAVSTDSFVIKPYFFPGGSIGKLAVVGTVNDLAVSGARPMYLTCGFVIEEGFSISDLKRIVADMAAEAAKMGVKIIAGDTKVVERGSADGIYINTTGIGVIERKPTLEFEEGDAIIVTGSLGDHGVSVLTSRGDIAITVPIQSDCASLSKMLATVTEYTNGVRVMRDPTRGGLATTLVEIAEDFRLTIKILESKLPIKAEVEGICDLLGFDPLYLANEGKAIIVVADAEKEKVVDILREFPEGRDAVIIGSVISKEKGILLLETPLGSKRILSRLTGSMLPRIC